MSFTILTLYFILSPTVRSVYNLASSFLLLFLLVIFYYILPFHPAGIRINFTLLVLCFFNVSLNDGSLYNLAVLLLLLEQFTVPSWWENLTVVVHNTLKLKVYMLVYPQTLTHL
jgi:hypothetical protein